MKLLHIQKKKRDVASNLWPTHKLPPADSLWKFNPDLPQGANLVWDHGMGGKAAAGFPSAPFPPPIGSLREGQVQQSGAACSHSGHKSDGRSILALKCFHVAKNQI